MTGNTKAAPRTVRRDATQILTADHKKVSKLYEAFNEKGDALARKAQLMEEYGIEPGKSAPDPRRPGGVQRHA